MNTSGISPSFLGLSRSSGQVTHVLLTRSRLCPRASPGSSLHLHVLSTPPAFVLSQDQTLREVRGWRLASRETEASRLQRASSTFGWALRTQRGARVHDGSIWAAGRAEATPGRSNRDASLTEGRSRCACCRVFKDRGAHSVAGDSRRGTRLRAPGNDP